MIQNERQYRITKAQAERFRSAIERFDRKGALANGIDPLIVAAQLRSLESQHQELVDDLAAYDELQSGISELVANGIDELPDLLIKARIVLKLSQRQLAERLGMREQQLQRYEAEHYRGASLQRLKEIAEALQLRIRVTAELGKEASDHRAAVEIREQVWSDQSSAQRDNNTERVEEFVAKAEGVLPVREMIDRGYFEDTIAKEHRSTRDLLLSFFQPKYVERCSTAMHRISTREGASLNYYALCAWQVKVLQKARRLRNEIAHGSIRNDPRWVKSLVELSNRSQGPLLARDFLHRSGIALIIERHLPQTQLDGASMLMEDTPVIGLTLRYDRLDNFWFVLLHEIAHIFLHRNRGLELGFFDINVENPSDQTTDAREEEADNFARTALVPDEAWNTSLVKLARTKGEVEAFAKRFGISVAVVAGRLRRERRDYSIFSDLVGGGQVREAFGKDWPR